MGNIILQHCSSIKIKTVIIYVFTACEAIVIRCGIIELA